MSALRRGLVWLHRWTGLTLALLLIIVGLTGSLLAFRDALDTRLNPDLLTVSGHGRPLMDPFDLRDRAAAMYPEGTFDDVPLEIRPDRSVRNVYMPTAQDGSGNMMRDMVEFYVDPYTGANLGERPVWSGPTLDRRNVISFLYRLHFALAGPWDWYVGSHSIGAFVLGVVALAWTIDCFLAFYLTFPLRFRVRPDGPAPASSWWRRWKPAWLIKWRADAVRVNFDIHRAFGLWTWALLFIFAWSSVGLNLQEVYVPTMSTLFGSTPVATQLPARATPDEHPLLGWRDAYARGQELLRAEADHRGVPVNGYADLSIDRSTGSYTLTAHSARDSGEAPEASVSFDADTGRRLAVDFPGDHPRTTNDALTYWLIAIHTAAVFGTPMRIAVCLIGIVITVLSITGIYIWWRKRRARLLSALVHSGMASR